MLFRKAQSSSQDTESGFSSFAASPSTSTTSSSSSASSTCESGSPTEHTSLLAKLVANRAKCPPAPASLAPAAPVASGRVGGRRLDLRCAICGAPTTCRHFAAISCSACAAFFRRTIAEKRNYECAHDGNCQVIADLVRRMCRACRFKKCIEVGMQESEVLSLGSAGKTRTNAIEEMDESASTTALMPCSSKASSSSTSTMQLPSTLPAPFYNDVADTGLKKNIARFTLSYNSIVYNRLSIAKDIDLTGRKVGTMPANARNCLSEAQVFHIFYKTVGLEEFVDFEQAKRVDVLTFWLVLQMIQNTIKHDGSSERRLYFIDHSSMPFTDDGITDWYATDPVLRRDPHCMTRLSSPMWTRIMDICRQIRESKFDNVEWSFFTVLAVADSLAHYAVDPVPLRKTLAPFVRNIFRSVETYYKENYSRGEVACRMGQMMMLLPLIYECNHMMEQHRTHMRLLGKDLDAHHSLLMEFLQDTHFELSLDVL